MVGGNGVGGNNYCDCVVEGGFPTEVMDESLILSVFLIFYVCNDLVSLLTFVKVS